MGQSGVYDLVPVPGTITETGTPLNKANLLSDQTATAIGLTGDVTVNDALREIGARPPAYNAYATDLYLYITGRHPVLCANIYNDYTSYLIQNTFAKIIKRIALSGDAQSIDVLDGYTRRI